MGSVWLAEHLALNSWVAIKLMDPSIAATVEGAERFKREAQAAASLRSAHVVQVLDYGVHETTPFLVMELLQGQSLADCLEREKKLTPERTLAIITQVARAIARAHASGIVHRDLKPDNIFLVKEDDQELAKVLDFGIAKTTGPRFGGMETRTGVTMGTPYYMSPEQVEGKKALDHRSDLWSLAVITCECMTGVRPFDGETYGELLLNICARPVAPPSSQGFYLAGFDEWFAKATNRDLNQRFNSAQELASALADVVQGRFRGAAPAVVTSPGGTVAMSPETAARLVGPIPAQTGGQAFSANTSGGASPPKKSSLLVPVLLASLVLLGAAIALALKLGGKHGDDSTAQLKLDLSATPASSSPVAVLPLAEAAPPASVTASPIVKPEARAASGEKPAGLGVPEVKLPVLAPVVAMPTSAPVAAAKPAAVKVERCYADPFTGQVRLAGNGHASDSFACKQNAFTGAYQRQ